MLDILRSLAPFSFILAIVIVAANKKIIRRLRFASAVTPQQAVSLSDLNWLVSWRLRRFVSAGAVRQTPDNRYYLDEIAYSSYRHRKAMIVIGAVVVATAIVLAVKLL